MKRLVIILIIFMITISIANSCKKKKMEDSYDLTHKDELFADLKTKPQGIAVQAGRDTTVYGKDTTMLHFYPNSFKDASGNIITSGTVNIELVEMYKTGDMVMNRTVTSANGKLLKSGGQVSIKATMNGKEVFANKYAIGFHSSISSNDEMSLFYGDNNNQDSVTTWVSSDTKIAGTVAKGTKCDTCTPWTKGTATGFSFMGGYFFLFEGCTQFKFVNCDRMYNPATKNTTVSIVMPDGSFVPSNTQIYIILPETNSATMGDTRQEYNSDTHTFILGNDDNLVPVGMQYVIVGIANKDGKYYFDMKKGTITEGLSVNLVMGEDTRFDIQSRLAGI